MQSNSILNIRRAAVLGAGVMGAQIAAHLTNAGVQTILFDLPSDKGDHNAIVGEALASLKKLKPLPLAIAGTENLIITANYNTDLAQLASCDFVIEAIAERFDWKQNLYTKVLPYLNENVLLATNTSGLSINKLASILPLALQKRFCGVHFFNPPRYMKLVELVPHETTDLQLLTQLETFLVTRLGKGVIYAKDTPNFIGNRVGVFAFLTILHHSKELGLTPDIVDALTGPLIGRSKSATFRTMDVVGLDTMAHVVNTLKNALKEDPWQNYFQLPIWIDELISKGALGQKKQGGIYKKIDNAILVYDYQERNYRPTSNHINSEVLTILRHKDPVQRFVLLSQSADQHAQFLWRIFRDMFHYCAYHLATIAHSVKDVDLAMRWGYGWLQGPFETWQLGGWAAIAKAISQEIAQGETLANVPLPNWVQTVAANGVYQGAKAFSASQQEFLASSTLPVYQRQYFPDQVITESAPEGTTIFETSAIRMWTMNQKVAIVSFKTKKNSISAAVLEGLQESIKRAEKEYCALILWQQDDQDFSVGANLKEVLDTLHSNQWDTLAKTVRLFQQTAQCLRYAQIPTVAAIKGLTLGGACELSMHTTQIVAALESYVGLVEVGVGLLPAGAGCKELAMRAAKLPNAEIYVAIQKFFEQIMRAQVSTSAFDAKTLNFLCDSDKVVFNDAELLFLAEKQAMKLADISYYPPLPYKFPVVGKSGIANLQTLLINLREGNFISDHDYQIGNKLAHVLCGGEVEAGTLVDAQWILDLEHSAILSLLGTSQTVDRIKYMLDKGKPLRN